MQRSTPRILEFGSVGEICQIISATWQLFILPYEYNVNRLSYCSSWEKMSWTITVFYL